MTRYFCDRCKDEVVSNQLLCVVKLETDSKGIHNEYELCGSCRNFLRREIDNYTHPPLQG